MSHTKQDRRRAEPMTKEREAVMNPPAASAGDMSDEEIDNILSDSFPASDPPSWTLGTHHRTPGPGFQD